MRLAHVGQLAQVALQGARQVIREEPMPLTRGGEMRLWIATGDDPLDERRTADGRIRNSRHVPGEQRVDDIALPTFDLRLRERPQRDERDPARQRVVDLRRREDVRGARHEEPPGSPRAVDVRLDREQQLGGALDLVDQHRPGEVGDERRRVHEREIADRLVVQAQRLGDPCTRCQPLRERALADLPRTHHEDHRAKGQCLGCERQCVARVEISHTRWKSIQNQEMQLADVRPAIWQISG